MKAHQEVSWEDPEEVADLIIKLDAEADAKKDVWVDAWESAWDAAWTQANIRSHPSSDGEESEDEAEVSESESEDNEDTHVAKADEFLEKDYWHSPEESTLDTFGNHWFNAESFESDEDTEEWNKVDLEPWWVYHYHGWY